MSLTKNLTFGFIYNIFFIFESKTINLNDNIFFSYLSLLFNCKFWLPFSILSSFSFSCFIFIISKEKVFDISNIFSSFFSFIISKWKDFDIFINFSFLFWLWIILKEKEFDKRMPKDLLILLFFLNISYFNGSIISYSLSFLLFSLSDFSQEIFILFSFEIIS